MPEVVVRTCVQDNALVIAMTGDLDVLTTPACADQVRRALASRPPESSLVVLDMRRIDFCGSVGLRMLANCASTCADEGLRVSVLAVPRGVVTRILGLAGLETLLPVVEDTTTASKPSLRPLSWPRTAS